MAEERKRRDENLLILLLLLLAFVATTRRAEAKPYRRSLSSRESVTATYYDSASATTPIRSGNESVAIACADEALASAPTIHHGHEPVGISYLDEALSPALHDGSELVRIDYYDAAPQAHNGYDPVSVSYSDAAEAGVFPSGISPYPFKPPSGWWRFYDFLRVDELYDPEWEVFGDIGFIRVENSVLSARCKTGGTGYIMFNTTRHVPPRVVTAFRVTDVSGTLPTHWLHYHIENGAEVVSFTLYSGTPNPDGTITTRIYDRNTGQYITGDITIRQDCWYAFYYDLTDNVIRLIDPDGNVVAEATPSKAPIDRVYFYVYFSLTGGNHTFNCDWLAIA